MISRRAIYPLFLREGTVYPALRVLEQDGLIVGRWEAQEKSADRKVYTLTEAGVKESRKRTQELRNYATLIRTVLRRIGHAQPA